MKSIPLRNSFLLNLVRNLICRYVDDTILCVPLNKIQILIDGFNSFHPRLQFTYEREINNRISFLDLELIRLADGGIITNWYRKNTYSGRILNFLSFHPFSNKIVVVKNLVDRAIGLSHDSFHYENLNILRKILFLNHYPPALIEKKIKISPYGF